ncbi:MAG TPA: hypothetical protein VHA74_02685, partial [Candidatus Dojkabacteria bacterium]|nr:hypothetical protein [Candidatus Dojkabacteria bacterium]
YPGLTPYQFASNCSIAAIDIDGTEAYFSTDGTFIRWGSVKGNTAPLIAVDANGVNHELGLSLEQFTNRINFAYGEGGGQAAEYFAYTIENLSVKYGEDDLYKSMNATGKPSTSAAQKQKMFANGEGGQAYMNFKNKIRKDGKTIDVTAFGNSKNNDAQDPEFTGHMKNIAAAVIESKLHPENDPTGGATNWVGGTTDYNDYVHTHNVVGEKITKVIETSYYGRENKYYFYQLEVKHDYDNTASMAIIDVDTAKNLANSSTPATASDGNVYSKENQVKK